MKIKGCTKKKKFRKLEFDFKVAINNTVHVHTCKYMLYSPLQAVTSCVASISFVA